MIEIWRGNITIKTSRSTRTVGAVREFQIELSSKTINYIVVMIFHNK